MGHHSVDYLNRMHKSLLEDQRGDTESCEANLVVVVEEGLQNLLQVHLNDGARHAARDVFEP